MPKNVNIKTPARDWSAHSSLIRKRYNVLRSPHPAEITTPCHSYLPQFGQFANKLTEHHTTRTAAHTTHSSANTLERNGFITFCFANNANFGGRNSLTKLKQQETREERKNVRFTA